MDQGQEPTTNHGVKTIIYPVGDLAQAKALYSTLLGVHPAFDTPYYVGFQIDGKDIGLDPNGHRGGAPGPVVYWHVDDIQAGLRSLLDAGAQPAQDVRDVGDGRLIATVADADGNLVGLLQEP
ncbi:MAG TPA: VOC family protein [Thermomicrobiales bacterium]|nr:VOC family protein [Thermomicrobiales bacterium]